MLMQEVLNVAGAVALAGLVVKEVFAYLNKKGSGGGEAVLILQEQLLNEMKKQNTNHLSHIQEAIEHGNSRIVDAINGGNIKTIELLGEIKGRLSK